MVFVMSYFQSKEEFLYQLDQMENSQRILPFQNMI